MDPVSAIGLTASVIGIAGLAETIVSKALKYLKAVKDCEEEVRSLVVELNVLAGILELLSPDDDNRDDDEPATKIPAHLVACQNTLNEIKRILDGFEHKAASVAIENQSKRAKIKGLSRLSKSDLKWPLSKGETMLLIETLSRHKISCILALCGGQTNMIHRALTEVGDTNQKIDALQEGQAVLLEAHASEELKEVTSWLSPVNPAEKHAVFISEYQPGTGLWIFERDEYKAWHSSMNSALYVYGIPGAGKTTLASLVVETMSANEPRGMAYFYGRHDDKLSQEGSFVLGSLVAQLAIQDQEAVEVALKLFKKHHPETKLATRPTEEELGELLQQMSTIFGKITLVIDGLDECGTESNRAKLIEVLSNLHDTSVGHIRVLVFGRPEHDIVRGLNLYTSISIKAASTDLQLYVAARLRPLKTRSDTLKEEIMDVLINHAEGMFQWVKCQVDYLLSPMTDAERREALKSLPPNLTSTYVRILQRIESKPNKKISIKVQRLLKWIVLCEGPPPRLGMPPPPPYSSVLTAAGLTHAISVEVGDKSLEWDRIPEVADIIAMLSSLVKHKPNIQGRVQLSHFTVKEFLTSSETEIAMQSDIPTTFVHKYLVSRQKDLDYLIDTSLTYLTLSNFHQPPMGHWDMTLKLLPEFPFYRYAALGLSQLLRDYDSSREETERFKQFFTVTPTQAYRFWFSAYVESQFSLDGSESSLLETPSLPETLPLHYACLVALEQTCKRLREEGADLEMRTYSMLTPLHLAINGSWRTGFHHKIGTGYISPTAAAESQQIRVIRCLLENNKVNHSAHLGSTAEITLKYSAKHLRKEAAYTGFGDVLRVSPLCLAILRDKPGICEYLLSMGASLDQTAAGLGENFTTIKAICKRLPPPSEIGFRMRAVLQRIIGEAGLEDELPHIRLLDVVVPGRTGRTPYNKAHILNTLRVDSLGALGKAIIEGEMHHVMNLISKQSAVADHRHALLACQCKMWDAVAVLQEHNVLLTDTDYLSVYEAYPEEARENLGQLEHRDINVPREKVVQLFRDNFINFAGDFPDLQEMQYLLSRLSPQEYIQAVDTMTSYTTTNTPKAVRFMLSNNLLDSHKIKSLLLECCIHNPASPEMRSLETLKALTEHNIDLNVVGTKGVAALHLAVQSRFLNHVRLLLNRGAAPDQHDKRGWTALHYAASESRHGGPSTEIVKLLFSVKPSVQSLVDRQTFDGSTALHLAAKEPKGLSVLRYLLRFVKFRNTKDGCEATVLYHAAAGGNHEAVRLLLKGQVFPLVAIDDQSDLHGSPLYAATLFAAQNDSINTSIKLLLEAGADVNITGHGQPLGPPLFVAAIYGSRSLMRLFLNHGADIMTGSRRYRSLIHLATDLRRPDIWLLLQDQMIKSVPKDYSESELEVDHNKGVNISGTSEVLEQLDRSRQAMIAQLDTSRQALSLERSPSESDDGNASDPELLVEDSNLKQDALETPLADDYPATDSSSWTTCTSMSSSNSADSSYASSVSKRSKRKTGSRSRWVRFKNAVFYRRRGRFKYKLSVYGTESGSRSLVDD